MGERPRTKRVCILKRVNEINLRSGTERVGGGEPREQTQRTVSVLGRLAPEPELGKIKPVKPNDRLVPLG